MKNKTRAYEIEFADMQGKKPGVKEGYTPSWWKLLMAKIFGIKTIYQCKYNHPMGYFYKGVMYVIHDDPCIEQEVKDKEDDHSI